MKKLGNLVESLRRRMIGVFDSGLGGLTVVKELRQRIPKYPILYFGDTARTPYGSKSPEVICGYAIEDAQFLIDRGAKIIIIACNSVSATAVPALREKFPKIRFYEVITPAAESAVNSLIPPLGKGGIKRGLYVGIVGTRATINSKAYTKAIHRLNPKIEVIQKECPLIVSMIEEGWYKSPELRSITQTYLKNLRGIDTLILGCTHYPIVKNIFQEIVGNEVKIIDCASSVVSRLIKDIDEEPNLHSICKNDRGSKFFVSDITPHFQKIASVWLEKDIVLEKLL